MNMQKEKIFIHMKIFRLLKNLDKFLGQGYNCQIYIGSGFIDKHSKADIDSINKAFKEKGLLKKIHGPFMELSPCSGDPKIRKVSLERFLSGLEICKGLNSESMTLHSHFYPIYYKRHFEEWLKNSKLVWDIVSKEADNMGITINIENSEDEDPDAIKALLESYPNFRTCFDVAHYNVFGKNGWEGALEEYPQGSINEVHLSDNNGDEDTHFPLGEGSIEIEKFLKIMNGRTEDPAVVLEPHNWDDLFKNIEYIEKLIKAD